MKTPAQAPLHIFFAGNHTANDGSQHEFSEADVADLVNSYDPELAEAQLVVGHPKIEDPSYGGVHSLVLDEKGVHAMPRNVDAEFAGLVNTGRFPSLSASIYRPGDQGNPKPGHFYLRHVGFLGAAPPALKGLKRPSLSFAADDGAVEFSMPLQRSVTSLGYYLKRLFQGLRDKSIETDGAEKTEQMIPQWCIDGIAEATADNDQMQAAFAEAITTENTMSDKTTGNAADFAEQQTQLATQKIQQDEREKVLNDRENAARRSDAVSFAEGLVAGGKLLPRQQAGIVELLLSMPTGTVLNFAEADGQAASDHPAPDVLRTFLADLPTRVDFAEKSRAAVEGAILNFAAPPGMTVTASDAELYGKAKAFQQQNPGASWATAVTSVGG